MLTRIFGKIKKEGISLIKKCTTKSFLTKVLMLLTLIGIYLVTLYFLNAYFEYYFVNRSPQLKRFIRYTLIYTENIGEIMLCAFRISMYFSMVISPFLYIDLVFLYFLMGFWGFARLFKINLEKVDESVILLINLLIYLIVLVTCILSVFPFVDYYLESWESVKIFFEYCFGAVPFLLYELYKLFLYILFFIFPFLVFAYFFYVYIAIREALKVEKNTLFVIIEDIMILLYCWFLLLLIILLFYSTEQNYDVVVYVRWWYVGILASIAVCFMYCLFWEYLWTFFMGAICLIWIYFGYETGFFFDVFCKVHLFLENFYPSKLEEVWKSGLTVGFFVVLTSSVYPFFFNDWLKKSFQENLVPIFMRLSESKFYFFFYFLFYCLFGLLWFAFFYLRIYVMGVQFMRFTI